MFLTASELFRLTGKKRFKAQCRALDGLKIAYTRAATGEPLVRQEALDAKAKPARNQEPRWDLLNA